jgi:RNA pol II accessory factor, Cdc73 family, C-terminal
VKNGEKKPDVLHIKRPLPSGKSLRFEIRDRVPSNGSKNWERVVAVVCSGKLWQFKKGYPFPVRCTFAYASVLSTASFL